MLHSKVTVNATSRVPEDAPGHSVLQHDMPDDEDLNCEDARKKKLVHTRSSLPLTPRASFSARRAQQSATRIGSLGSVSSLGFRSRRLDLSGRSGESVLAAVTSLMS